MLISEDFVKTLAKLLAGNFLKRRKSKLSSVMKHWMVMIFGLTVLTSVIIEDKVAKLSSSEEFTPRQVKSRFKGVILSILKT